MAFKPVFKKGTWSGLIKIKKGHLGRLYILIKKTTSIKNARAQGMKKGIVRSNTSNLRQGY